MYFAEYEAVIQLPGIFRLYLCIAYCAQERHGNGRRLYLTRQYRTG